MKGRYKLRPDLAGGQLILHTRLAKLRALKPFPVKYSVVNLDLISELFPEGGTVRIKDLVAKGVVPTNAPVKVLGSGEIKAKIDITAHAFTPTAVKKIRAAGGKVKVSRRQIIPKRRR